MKERIAILLGFMNDQRNILFRIFDQLINMEPLDENKTIHCAYLLHNLYNAYEDLFKEISVSFENNIEQSAGFHKNILLRMKHTIPGIRPRVISDDSFVLLSELLAFRHVFRHAYNYNLDAHKIQELRKKLTQKNNRVQKDLDGFESFLKDVLDT
ncbi:MAG: hypothetical protein ACOCXO_01390 [Bacteroidota bacterium]